MKVFSGILYLSQRTRTTPKLHSLLLPFTNSVTGKPPIAVEEGGLPLPATTFLLPSLPILDWLEKREMKGLKKLCSRGRRLLVLSGLLKLGFLLHTRHKCFPNLNI